LTLSFASLAFDTGTKDGEQKEMLGNCHGTPSFKVAKRVEKSRESQGRALSSVKGVRLNVDLRLAQCATPQNKSMNSPLEWAGGTLTENGNCELTVSKTHCD